MPRAFILSKDIEEIFPIFHVADKVKYLGETCGILHVLFQSSMTESRFASIPEVAMWEGYEATLLLYFEMQIEDLRKTGQLSNSPAMLQAANQYDSVLEVFKKQIWGDAQDITSGIGLELHNPILNASDDFIASHQIALVGTDPFYYGKYFPQHEDLSWTYATDWNYCEQGS
jgi:hypothetical protein